MRATDAPARRMRSRIMAGVAVAGLVLMAAARPRRTTHPHRRPASPARRRCRSTGPRRSWSATPTSVDTLNPYVGFTQQDFEVYGMVYDQLMDYGQLDYKPSPRLATSWSHSQDGLTWTYNIRHGREVVRRRAADRRRRGLHVQPRHPRPGRARRHLSYIQNITSVKATGKYTVVMKVSKPTPGMDLLIVSILPEHIWKNVPEKQGHHVRQQQPGWLGPVHRDQVPGRASTSTSRRTPTTGAASRASLK